MSEPLGEWTCNTHDNMDFEQKDSGVDQSVNNSAGCSKVLFSAQNDLSYQSVPSFNEEDEELTETKIRAFLDEKVSLVILLKITYRSDSCYK